MIVRENCEGTPFKIGDKVKIMKGVDDTFEKALEGMEGEVTGFQGNGMVGNRFPGDPLILVKVNGIPEEKSLWKEEITHV